MSARVYFMLRVNDCKDMAIMSPKDEQWSRTSLLCLYTVIFLFYYVHCTSVCSQNRNKQLVNIAGETLTDYGFLSRYHYTKSKNYLKRRFVTEFPCLLGYPVHKWKYPIKEYCIFQDKTTCKQLWRRKDEYVIIIQSKV